MIQPSSPSPFLQVCSGRPAKTTPIWLMRQAGRVLEPYRRLREKYGSIRTLFTTPDLAAEITLMPVEMLGVDAAILFTDLVTPLEPMGCSFAYDPGPVFARPVRSRTDVKRLRTLDTSADLPFVLETIRSVRSALPPSVPLIGYAGAPFTLAAWLAQGKGSKDFSWIRRLLYRDPETVRLLIEKLSESIIDFLSAQVQAGAQAVQLFDTSIGLLSPREFRSFALPALQRIFAALGRLGVPRIYFPLDGAHLLSFVRGIEADVLSIDWRIDLGDAFDLLPQGRVIQGNMDPCMLYADPARIASEARRIVGAADGRPHIFNLGHGLLPDTPFDHVRALVDAVHEYAPAAEALRYRRSTETELKQS